MKNILFRVGLLALALLLCMSVVGCADDESVQTPEPNDPGTSSDEQPEEPEIEQILPEIEQKDYDYTLNVMHWTVEGNHEYYNLWLEICPDEGVTGPMGDLIADDIYDRSGWMEENYGITITCRYEPHVGLPTTIANLIKSGSDEYQVLVDFGFNAQRSMGQNYYLNLNELPNIDPSKPWWVSDPLKTLPSVTT